MVSVIIPTYNRKKSIVCAVESVLNQTYKDIEVIVVDDGSLDNTKEVLDAVKDKRLRYVYQENAGACVARNHGIELARGEHIAFQDSDDIWLPQKLEKQLDIIERYDADIVFCKLNKKTNGHIVLSPDYTKEGFLNPIENLFGIGTQTILGKREVFRKIRFDDKLPRFQEFEMLYLASKEFSIYCLDEGLANYEIGEDSISCNPEKLYQACNIILKKHPEMEKQYPVMMTYMAHSLLSAANVARKRKIGMKKYLDLSWSCAKSPRLTIKAVLVVLGVYDLQRKIAGK